MGKKYRFYYIPLSVIIAIVLAGAAIYFYNVTRQNKLSQKNLTEERLLNEINTCHNNYLIASKEKRAYQFYKIPYFLTNYETSKKKVQAQVKLLNELFKKDTVYSTFIIYRQLLNNRFIQMDQHLRLIQTLPLTEAREKINSDNGSVIESNQQTEVLFQQLMQAVESRSIAMEKSITQIERSNFYGFILLIVSAIVLILLNAIQTKKLTLENNRRENEKKLYDAVKINEQEFSSAFEYASIGIALVGINGEWLWVNNSLCNMLGYSNREFLQTTFQDITHPEDLGIDLAYLKQLINNEISTYQMEKRYFTKKGEIIWINLSVSKVLNSDGSIRYFISQIENIHERKTAALILNAEKERFENVIEGTNAGTWEWNVQTGETVFNKRWAAIVGYTLSELEPIDINTWLKLAHPDDLAESGKKLNECFEKKEPYYECECRMKHKNGHWVWVLDRGKVISWTADGKPLMMFGTHSDINHQKETEFLLQQSENKFRGIFNSTFQFIGFLATDGTLLEVNNTALEFGGLQLQDVIGKKFWDCYWWQLSGDTQEQLKMSLLKAAAGQFIQYEVEIWDKNKNRKTILFNLKPLLNNQGEVTAIIPEGRLIQDMVDARKKILEKIPSCNNLLQTPHMI